MKNQVKKISFLIFSILLVAACSNSNRTNTDTKKHSSQPKESFSENVMVKLFGSYLAYYFPSNNEDYLKNEYESIDKLMVDNFGNWESLKRGEFEPKLFKKREKIIEEAEEMSKSKFFLKKDEYGLPEAIFFTPKESTGYDMCKILLDDGFLHLATQIDKISVKEYVNKRGLWLLHEDMREGVDIKSLGLDPATTEKLLEAQNYKGN